MEYAVFGIGAVILLLFVAFGAGAYFLLGSNRTSADRLQEMTRQSAEDDFSLGGSQENDGAVVQVAERLGQLAKPQSEEELGVLRKRMYMAGFRSKYALEVFNAVRVLLSVSVPLLVGLFAITMVEDFTQVLVIILVTMLACYYGPDMYITNTITKRKAELLLVFPDALDMLVAAVEAGLGVDAAFRRVANELSAAAPALAREFQQVNHEVAAGVPRVDALKRLNERTGLDEIRSLVNTLTQAERFGTSIARSLRVHSNVVRAQRMAKAEEEAAKIAPKLTIAMIIFMLPCLISILLGPAFIRIAETLG